MNFKIVFFPYSKKQGLALLEEYERLNFPENHQGNKFEAGPTSINVDTNVAKCLPDVFGNSTTAYINIDSTLTTANSWEVDGYGIRLKEIDLSSAFDRMIAREKPGITGPSESDDTAHFDTTNHNNIHQKPTKRDMVIMPRKPTKKDIRFATGYRLSADKLIKELEDLKTTNFLELRLSDLEKKK